MEESDLTAFKRREEDFLHEHPRWVYERGVQTYTFLRRLSVEVGVLQALLGIGGLVGFYEVVVANAENHTLLEKGIAAAGLISVPYLFNEAYKSLFAQRQEWAREITEAERVLRECDRIRRLYHRESE